MPPAGPPPEFRRPDVTLIAGEERTVHEYRHNGQLRMIKVVPKRGKPYYLVPRDHTRGWGDLEQAEALQAEWVIWEFWPAALPRHDEGMVAPVAPRAFNCLH